MSDHYDALGQLLTLGPQLGAGGEGAVFELPGDGRYVAKIYHQEITSDKTDKLRAMVKLASPELTAFAAWPAGTVHAGRNGPVVGVVLPRVKGHRPIQNLYSPAHRRANFPDKDWSFLLHACMNCAAAFDSIHSKSHVIGDVNQGNLLVSAQGTVFFIDCDSFQITFEGRLFPCEVAVAHFTPPELQGKSLRGVQRTPNHDNFGLAVLLFHLLFLGRHPFAGRYAGADDMSIERAIQEFRFAFSRNAAELQMAPPPDTLALEQLVPSLAAMFERAFLHGSDQPGARPSARQWYEALKALRGQICGCTADEGHRYFNKLKACPWCQIVEMNGVNFFASVTVYRLTTGSFDVTPEIERAWQQIEAIKPPASELPETRRQAPPAPTSLPPALERSRVARNIFRTMALVDLLLVLVTAPLLWPLFVTVPLFLILFVLWTLSTSTVFGEEVSQRYLRRLTRREEIKRLKSEWKTLAFDLGAQFDDAKMPLASAYEQLKGLKDAYRAAYAELRGRGVERQRIRYLQGVVLSDVQIDGIGPTTTAELAFYGFETAYDIDLQRLQQTRNFTRTAMETLVAWRRRMETEFRYDATQGVPEADRQALAHKFIRTWQELKQTLTAGVDELRDVAKDADRTLKEFEHRYRQEEAAVAQAEADFRAVS